MLPINPGLRDILRRAVTTQRVARYWSLLHRSTVAELNMKLRLNSFFSKPCSTHDRDCWKLGCVLLKHWGIRVITDGCHWSVCPNHILIDRWDTGLANNGRDTAHIVCCQPPGETFNYWHWLTMGKHGADLRWEIRVRLWPSPGKCPSQQRVFVRPGETNPDWVCVINFNRGMFYVSLLMGHCISILTESSITLFVTSSYNDKDIFNLQSDVYSSLFIKAAVISDWCVAM